MLRVTALIASGGKLFQPFVVNKVDDVDVFPKKIKEIQLQQEHLDLIRAGMELVVGSETGTGQKAKSKAIAISGKTGTAQAPRGQDHAWFVGYAPSDNPKAAIVVFLEHGGKGGQRAAPLAKRIFEWMNDHGYFV